MSSTNSGPAQTVTPNYVAQSAPAGSASVPFDPLNVNIGGGSIGNVGVSMLGSLNAKGIARLGDLTAAVAAYSSASASAPTTWVRLGDSTTAGLGAGQGTNWTNAAQRNVSYQLASVSGGTVSNDSFIGDAGGGVSPGYSVYNPLVTLGNGWATNTPTLGGTFFKYSIGGTGTLRFAAPAGATKVRVFYLPGQAATVQTDLGVIGTIPSGTGGIAYADYSLQNGATYAEIANPATTTYILGMAFINAAQKVLLLNAGYNGGKVSDFTPAVNNYDALPTLKALAPSLTEINLTINDANAPTVKATYQAGLVTLVEAALLSGSVVLKFGAVSNTTASTNGSLYDIQDAMMTVAATYNLTVLSTPAALGGGFANANAKGYMADSWHQTYAGQTAEMNACQQRLLAAIQNR